VNGWKLFIIKHKGRPPIFGTGLAIDKEEPPTLEISMKMNHDTKLKKARRSLIRETLMAMIGLTMGACTADTSSPECPEQDASQAATAQFDPRSAADVAAAQGANLDLPEEPTIALPTPIALPPLNGPTLKTTGPKATFLAKAPALQPGKLTPHRVKTSLGVIGSATGVGVDQRTPLGVATTFSSDVEKVWAFIKVRNTLRDTKVRMVWKRDGKTRMQVNLKVGKSKGWRTWSYRKMGHRDVGAWTIDVLDMRGETLHTMAFDVTRPEEIAQR
jgi:hypothetical protein